MVPPRGDRTTSNPGRRARMDLSRRKYGGRGIGERSLDLREYQKKHFRNEETGKEGIDIKNGENGHPFPTARRSHQTVIRYQYRGVCNPPRYSNIAAIHVLALDIFNSFEAQAISKHEECSKRLPMHPRLHEECSHERAHFSGHGPHLVPSWQGRKHRCPHGLGLPHSCQKAKRQWWAIPVRIGEGGSTFRRIL